MVGYKADKAHNLYRTLLDRIPALPGARGASVSMDAPLSGSSNGTELKIEGYKPQSGRELIPVSLNIVGPGYFRTLETPILLRRDFTSGDQADAPKVAIINETAAHKYFGDTNPLGRRISVPGWVGDPSWFEIVGVVKDAKQRDLRQGPTATAYMPVFQSGIPSGVTFEVRTATNPVTTTTAVLHTIGQTDTRLPIFNVRTLNEQVDDSLLEERMITSLSSLFGVLAVLLACIGMYGLMSYGVNRRNSEIGIRMALGAKRTQIARMILRETLLLVAIGLAIGIPVSFAAARLIRSELYGLQPGDPVTIFMAGIFRAAIATFAAYLPARRASHVDPMTALRYE